MTIKPIYLVSLNKTPERAAFLVGQLLDSLRSDHGIIHVANSSTLHGLKDLLEALVYPPEILICSSQWTVEEQKQANTIAKTVLPQVNLVNIPSGLDVREGSDGILRFLKGAIESLESSDDGKYVNSKFET